MERIGRPEDDFRERLARSDIERVCASHGIGKPAKIVPEQRGNEMVAYHLDDTYFLSFGMTDCTQRKVEVLKVFEHLEAMPTPKVIAWSPQDPVLHVPYMILERCPGVRLDVAWEQCGPEERLQLLGTLGTAMGRYHTITLEDAKAAARTAGFEQWVISDTEPDLHRANESRRKALNSLRDLSERLGRWEIDSSSLVASLEKHYAGDSPAPAVPFVGPGLVHTEPCPEHFIVERTGKTFRLSGCVDLEECGIADSFHEIIKMYVSMLALDEKNLPAFRKGYEQFFPFPPDAERRLRAGAVDHDLGEILWLLDTMEKRSEWHFATCWVVGHIQRLEGWLDERNRVKRALFRKDIGPW